MGIQQASTICITFTSDCNTVFIIRWIHDIWLFTLIITIWQTCAGRSATSEVKPSNRKWSQVNEAKSSEMVSQSEGSSQVKGMRYFLRSKWSEVKWSEGGSEGREVVQMNGDGDDSSSQVKSGMSRFLVGKWIGRMVMDWLVSTLNLVVIYVIGMPSDEYLVVRQLYVFVFHSSFHHCNHFITTIISSSSSSS